MFFILFYCVLGRFVGLHPFSYEMMLYHTVKSVMKSKFQWPQNIYHKSDISFYWNGTDIHKGPSRKWWWTLRFHKRLESFWAHKISVSWGYLCSVELFEQNSSLRGKIWSFYSDVRLGCGLDCCSKLYFCIIPLFWRNFLSLCVEVKLERSQHVLQNVGI